MTDVLTGSRQVALLLWMEYDSSKQAPPSTGSKTCCQDHLEAVDGTLRPFILTPVSQPQWLLQPANRK
jgi:hypothetical protein